MYKKYKCLNIINKYILIKITVYSPIISNLCLKILLQYLELIIFTLNFFLSVLMYKNKIKI